MGYRDYSVVKGLIVDGSGHGDFTTIASAITAAVASGASASAPLNVYINAKATGAAYTENLTLQPGVNLVGLGYNPTIIGKLTYTQAGTVSIGGLTLQTNSDFFLSVTGSAASVVNLTDCNLVALNNTGINYTSSNAASQINFTSCYGDVATTGITIYSMTSAGVLNFFYSNWTDSGGSTTASNNSAGAVQMFNCVNIRCPLTTSSAGTLSVVGTSVTTSNVASITTAGTGSASITSSTLSSGSASAVSIGTGTTAIIFHSVLNCSNTNALTGAGTLTYAACNFQNSSGINVTTVTSDSYFKSLIQVFTSTGTYTPTKGLVYCIIECVGGGGGGGGAGASGATNQNTSGGGASGGYSRKASTAATIGSSQAVTVGAAGAAGASGANNGGAGGATSVGAICIANGGGGGGGSSAASWAFGGTPGAAGTGDLTLLGQYGGSGCGGGTITTIGFTSGGGGNSMFGPGALGQSQPVSASGTGNAASAGAYGGGGGGAMSYAASGAAAGGAGQTGIVVITEYVL